MLQFNEALAKKQANEFADKDGSIPASRTYRHYMAGRRAEFAYLKSLEEDQEKYRQKVQEYMQEYRKKHPEKSWNPIDQIRLINSFMDAFESECYVSHGLLGNPFSFIRSGLKQLEEKILNKEPLV